MTPATALKKFFPYGSRRHAMLTQLVEPHTPSALRRNHRQLSAEDQRKLKESLIRNFFTDTSYYPDPPDIYLATEMGQSDLNDHLTGRLSSFRSIVVPWLDATIPLKGKRILEIGAGTGASTVALAEQGARVFGIDVSEGALTVARERCRLYNLEASFTTGNAAKLDQVIGDLSFDCIVYFAVLEHMTWPERFASLSTAWKRLKPGQHLVVIETPNRLWHTDTHTSGEPFFHWISDEVAYDYSRCTKREIYNRTFSGPITDAGRTLLARWGRGSSYHEFALSFDLSPEALPVVSHLAEFRKQGLAALRPGNDFEAILRKLAPGIHPGFLTSYLDLIFEKR
jgi:2-polyprenyl-3-methyl-5-hydroxy-6-metoxy-1,4-benzoquinol methylase